MKIVVLDGHTLNPGDLSWQGFEVLGDVEVHERTRPEQVLERCRGAEVVLTNKVPLTDQLMAQLPELRYIGVLATGYNVVDVSAARQRDIVVTNTPAYGTHSVAQFVFAQLLQWAQPVAYYSDSVKHNRWSQTPDFCYYDHAMVELAGMTLGIIGFGAIGQQVARIARAFGMCVQIHTRTPPAHLPDGVEVVDLPTLAETCDVISLHCPLTEANAGFIDRDFLATMKPGAYLINTGRGPLIDEAALYDALYSGHLAGAALDVLSVEPPEVDHPLFSLPTCTITPHIAWATTAARQRLMGIAVDNLNAFLAGTPQNRV